MTDICIHYTNNQGTPLYELRPNNNKKTEVIFFLHGFLSQKEHILRQAYKLAGEGYLVVCPDAPFHGEAGKWDFLSLQPHQQAARIPEIMSKTADTLDMLIPYYKTTHPLAGNRVGLCGISMGGNTIFEYITRKSTMDIDCVVTMLSTPIWHTTFVRYINELPGASNFFPQDLTLELQKIEPANHVTLLTRFPLLALVGREDRVVTDSQLIDFFELLHKKNPTISLSIFDKVGHYVPDEMFAACISHFNIVLRNSRKV